LASDRASGSAVPAFKTCGANAKSKTYSDSLGETGWDLALAPHVLNAGTAEPEALSLAKLKEYSRDLSGNHVQSGSFQLEFWQRIFQPLAVVVMVLLAMPFVFAAPRAVNIGKRIVLAMIVGFVFYVLTALLGQLSIVFQFPPLIAALLPIVLFAIAGCLLMQRVI
jgi:lipopolysaccharide export system permease protein